MPKVTFIKDGKETVVPADTVIQLVVTVGRQLAAAGFSRLVLFNGHGGQIALLRGDTCSRVLMLGKRYLVPRGDGLTLVGSTEEPESGFEKRTTPEGVAGLLAFARATVPALARAALETAWAGLRPGSPDGLPFLGPVPGAEGVFVATGLAATAFASGPSA